MSSQRPDLSQSMGAVELLVYLKHRGPLYRGESPIMHILARLLSTLNLLHSRWEGPRAQCFSVRKVR